MSRESTRYDRHTFADARRARSEAEPRGPALARRRVRGGGGAAAVVAAGLMVSCGEGLQPAPEDPEAARTMLVNTARGPVTVAYADVNGWAVADGDIILGRIEDEGIRPRDTHVGAERWQNGIIPYVWDLWDGFLNDRCASDNVQFCGGEMLYYEQEGSPWRKFVEAVADETSLSLVDATNCYYDQACPMPQHYVFIRRPFLLNDDDNEQQCAAINNIDQQITVVTFTGAVPGQWDLTIAGETFSVIGGADPNEVAADLDQEIIDWELYDDLPVTVDVDGNVMTITGTESESVEVTVEGPMGSTFTLETTQNACVGARGCRNSDCSVDQVCAAVWPYPQEWSNENVGSCQQMNGHASLGQGAENSMGLPLAWFHGNNFSGMGHELLHVAGFLHEQQRPDAGPKVEIADLSCLVIPQPNFEVSQEADLYGWSGPVDFASTMMYGSSNGCSGAPECEYQCLNVLDGECPAEICGLDNPEDPALDVIKPPGWFEGYDDFGKGIGGKKISRGTLGLSYGDQDALRMYAGDSFVQAFVEGQCPWMPKNGVEVPGFAYSGAEADDEFGAALALGQFGDEDHAIIVGSPGEAEDYLDIASGAATVWESTIYTQELPFGVVDPNRHMPALPSHAPDQFMVPQSFDEGAAPEAGDRFGAAVVAVDLDGDGIDEIAVGAPDGGINGSGVVYLYKTGSSKRKHKPWKILTPSDHFMSDDTRDFGTALAAGNFARGPANGACDNLREELAVGSPGGDANGGIMGSVVVFRYVGDDVVEQTVITPPPATGEQRFGQALAAADLDGDGQDGLVVGAPTYSNNRGRAYFYEQKTLGGACSMPFNYLTFRNGTHVGVRYGSAIAAGDFLRGTAPGFGNDDVAVGALGSSAQAGYVDIFRATNNDPLFVHQIKQSTVNNPHNLAFGADPIGDEFGYALAVVPYTSDERPAYLFVGAPGEVVNGFGTGMVYQLNFLDNTAEVKNIYLGGKRETSACPAGAAWGCGLLSLDDNNWAQRFGAALAADERVVVMGDPAYNLVQGENWVDNSAGAIRIYERERDRTEPDAWHLMRWQAEDRAWPEAPGLIAAP